MGIAVDVTHATDYPTVNKAQHGDIKVGEMVNLSFTSSNGKRVVSEVNAAH